MDDSVAPAGGNLAAHCVLVFLFCVPELAFRLHEVAFYGLKHVSGKVGHARNIDLPMLRTYSGTLRTCSSTFERISA
jgi:hypothetical protein